VAGQVNRVGGWYGFNIWPQGRWSEAFNFAFGFFSYLLDRTILTFRIYLETH